MSFWIGWRSGRDQRLPIVLADRCTGCGDCVQVCPTRCLERGAMVPWLPRPADCIVCGLCSSICPAEAVRLAHPGDV